MRKVGVHEVGYLGLLSRGMKRNSQFGSKFRSVWLAERELERWFQEHPKHRLTQTMKRYLVAEYDLSESDILNASRRVRRRLRV